MFRCFEHREYRQALGIAIETKRLDIFERAITGDKTETQVYIFVMIICFVIGITIEKIS